MENLESKDTNIIEDENLSEEQKIVNSIADFSSRLKKIKQDASKSPDAINYQYGELKKEEEKYASFSQKLGIKFTHPLDKKTFEERISTIENNIAQMQIHLDKMRIDESSSMEDIKSALTSLIRYTGILGEAYTRGTQLAEVVSLYSAEALETSKKGIDEKANDLIKQTKLKLLDRKKQEIENRKISFWGKLRGLDKLKAAELEGVQLEIDLVRNSPVIPKTSYSVRETLSDLKVFSMRELGNHYTEEMQVFNDTVKEFYSIDEASIQELAVRKMNAHPMVIDTSKKRESTKSKIAKVVNRNEGLRVDISKAKYAAEKHSDSVERYNSNDSRKRFLSILDKVAEKTNMFDGHNDEARTKISAQITEESYVK